jgi:hypothetical protein
MQLVQKVEVTRGQHGYISMSNCFPSFIVCWILNFVDLPTHENWYPTNKSDFTVSSKNRKLSTKHTYKTKDRVTQTQLKPGGECGCSGKVSSSCSTSDRVKILDKSDMGNRRIVSLHL